MYEGVLQDLIDELGRLPGIGPKSAQRLAFYLMEAEEAEVRSLIEAIGAVKQKVKFCETCGNVTEGATCSICTDSRRDTSAICVVEEAKDIQALERTRVFRGRYHVLGGVIDPINGVGPDQLRMRELYQRLANGEVKEVILATNPTIEGEATATYVARMLSPLELSVSRLASGLPVGGDLEYADEVTLGRALEGRRSISAAHPNETNG